MKNSKISNRRKNIEYQLQYWKHRLQDLQDECPHKDYEVINCSDKEEQWNQFVCNECGKSWIETL